MPENNVTKEEFYTLDEEKRELVPNGIQVGDGFDVFMRISKKYITRNPSDEKVKVNINIAELINISVSTQRKTTADYLPGMKDPQYFSRGNEIGNGRIVCPILDRELITFIYKEMKNYDPDAKIFELSESQGTFGSVFEVFEQSQSELTENTEELVGGTSEFFSKDKEFIYLDDIPPFDILMLGRADGARNVYELGNPPVDGVSEMRKGLIYQRIISRVQFTSNSTGANAVDAIGNEVIDFIIYGKDSGWKEVL